MTDDIVTRLRIACRQEGAEYCGECQPCQAADEIERLRELANALYEETKRCGTTHDTNACWNYEQWLEDND